MDLNIYWQIFVNTEKTIECERKNSSLALAFVNVSLALLLFLSLALRKPVLFFDDPAFFLIEGLGFFLSGLFTYLIICGLLHIGASLLGGKGNFVELSYFLSSFLLLYFVIAAMITPPLFHASHLFTSVIFYSPLTWVLSFYMLYLTYRILQALYVGLASIKVAAIVLLTGFIYKELGFLIINKVVIPILNSLF